MSIPFQQAPPVTTTGPRRGGRSGSATVATPVASVADPVFPTVATFDDADMPVDVIDTLALRPFTSGEQPWARTVRIDRLRPEATLLPTGARPLRGAVENSRESQLAAGEGWTLRAVRWRGGGAEVTVTAVSDELARSVLDGVVREAAAEAPAGESVRVGFWHLSSRHGPIRTPRPISTAPWSSIRRNYATGAATALDRLMAVTRDTIFGRIILLHGPAGTGKTTVLRTLAHEWRDWCQVDSVLDPEALFADPGYMVQAAVGYDGTEDDEDDEPDGDTSGEDGGATSRRRWRLLVVEDCDDLVRVGAGGGGSAGPALSRLLNLTDGLAGQGRDILVALTTNESLTLMHPAVVRPGRCLAQIEIGPLPFAEATAWLGMRKGVRSSMSLAELYALREGRAGATARIQPEGQAGPYL